jgi:hypothetical protein
VFVRVVKVELPRVRTPRAGIAGVAGTVRGMIAFGLGPEEGI